MAISYKPDNALTCQQVRAIDAWAINELGIPGIVLMENAGSGAAEFIYAELADPSRASVLVLCGPGNNGGDGFVIARHLSSAGVRVTVVLAMARERSTGDAAINLRIWERLGGSVIDASMSQELDRARELAARSDVIVDALLGTGSSGGPRGVIGKLVRIANETPQARRIAIDIPTGLDADTGVVSEPCFQAQATVTLIAEKVGFASPAARAALGSVMVLGIGAPRMPVSR